MAKLLIVSLAPVIIFLLPIILIFYLMCKWYRLIVSLVVNWFKPGFGKMMECWSAPFADDNFNTASPYNANLCCSIQLDGRLLLKEVTPIFIKNVLNAKLNSKIRYPELRQYYADFMSCGFWKDDPSFDIRNHIYEMGCPKGITGLEEVHRWHVNRAFPNKRSPWELLLIKNFFEERANKSLLVFRIHHAMCDAKSVCQLVMGCLGDKVLKLAEAAHAGEDERTSYEKCLGNIRFPYDFALSVILLLKVFVAAFLHPFKMPESKMRKASVNVGFSDLIQMGELKSIAKQAGVRPSAIIYSVLGGALGKLKEEIGSSRGVPMGFPLNKPGHPDGLTNHFNIFFTTLKTDVEVPPMDRLLAFNREYIAINSGNKTDCTYFQFLLAGTAPNFIRRSIRKLFLQHRRGFLFLFSNMAFDEEGFSVGDKLPCTDFRISCGCSRLAFAGLIIFSQSYKGGIRYTVNANSHLLSSDETKQLATLISEEYDCLKKVVKGVNPG